jgi:hypothetical protein
MTFFGLCRVTHSADWLVLLQELMPLKTQLLEEKKAREAQAGATATAHRIKVGAEHKRVLGCDAVSCDARN